MALLPRIASALGLPPSGGGWREPNPDCARFWPSGRSSSSLWPVVGRRSACAFDHNVRLYLDDYLLAAPDNPLHM